MKKCFQKSFLLIVAFFSTTTFLSAQDKKKCCEDETCKAAVKDFAARLTPLVANLPHSSGDDDVDKKVLDSLKRANRQLYDELVKLAKAAHDYIFSDGSPFRNDGCFSNALSDDVRIDVLGWVAHVGRSAPKFGSAEFCAGLKVRIELGGGSTDISKYSVGYLGSLRGFLVYTFYDKGGDKKKDPFRCGNHIRLMVGPAAFFRSHMLYGALSSRIGVRVKDITPMNFAIGNINLFGEYSTSFGNLSYGALGAELELGFIGFNLSVNNNMKTGRKGLGVNVFYRFK